MQAGITNVHTHTITCNFESFYDTTKSMQQKPISHTHKQFLMMMVGWVEMARQPCVYTVITERRAQTNTGQYVKLNLMNARAFSNSRAIKATKQQQHLVVEINFLWKFIYWINILNGRSGGGSTKRARHARVRSFSLTQINQTFWVENSNGPLRAKH